LVGQHFSEQEGLKSKEIHPTRVLIVGLHEMPIIIQVISFSEDGNLWRVQQDGGERYQALLLCNMFAS
jgi:hypothetical protein